MIADRNVSNTKQNRMYIITKRTAIFCSPLFFALPFSVEGVPRNSLSSFYIKMRLPAAGNLNKN